jgi:hypothetical protein
MCNTYIATGERYGLGFCNCNLMCTRHRRHANATSSFLYLRRRTANVFSSDRSGSTQLHKLSGAKELLFDAKIADHQGRQPYRALPPADCNVQSDISTVGCEVLVEPHFRSLWRVLRRTVPAGHTWTCATFR